LCEDSKMDDLLTVIIGLVVSAVTSFVVAKYYGERWVETRRSKKEHSTKLNDSFFKPWLSKIGEYNDEYCKIDAVYSREIGKVVPSKPRDPDNLQFHEEAMSHLKKYHQLLSDWDKLKQITLELNEELASLFEEIRILVKKEADLPYWCPDYSGDEPFEYLCPTIFIRAIYDEIFYRLKRNVKQFIGSGNITPTIYGDKKIYCYNWWNRNLARSPDEETIKKTQLSFSHLIEDGGYGERMKHFAARQKENYDNQLEKVKQDIGDIIKSIELGKIIKGKCQYCK